MRPSARSRASSAASAKAREAHFVASDSSEEPKMIKETQTLSPYAREAARHVPAASRRDSHYSMECLKTRKNQRKCMGIEPTERRVDRRPSGFEDRGHHQVCRHFRGRRWDTRRTILGPTPAPGTGSVCPRPSRAKGQTL